MNAIIRHCVVVAAILAPIPRVLGADDWQPGSPVLDVYMIRNQELRYKWCDTTNTKRCCNQGTTNPDEGCIMFGLDLGKSPRTLLEENIRLVYNELSAGSRLYSPVGFRLVAGAAIHNVSRDKTQGQTPRTITFCDSAGRFRTFRFKDGASTALIETGSAEYAAEFVTMLDGNGWATSEAPSLYEYSDPKGRLFRFGADPSDPETYLQLVSVRFPGGRTEMGDDIGFEILRDAEGTPRQIVGPAKIAVLPDAPAGEVGYDIVLYPNDASTTSWQRDAAGFYILDPEAEPLVTWRVRNPEPETDLQVEISKVVGDSSPVTWRFVYDPELEDFSLVYPDAVMKAFSGLYFSEDGNSVVREKFKTADGEKFAHETTEFRKFGNVFRRISTTRDPDGLALKSEYSYYDDATRNGLEKSVVYEDGSWERFDYDASRRLSKKVSPWLDSDLDDPDEESVCTTYDYAPFLASDVVRWNDTRPRVETTRTTGIETSRFYYAYPTNGAGRSLSIKEQAGAQGAPFGDPRNRRWTTEFYGPADGAFLHGRVAVETDFTGWTAAHTYERGFVNLATYSFAPDPAGDAWRETILRTKPGAMTRRFRSVRTAQGNEVLSTEEGLHESGEWIPLATVKRAYDRNGNLVRRETQDGRVEEWSYGLNCCGMESYTTWDGQRYVYTYDKLGNMLSETKTGLRSDESDSLTTLFHRRQDGQLNGIVLTNFVEEIGILEKQYEYDSIGRIRSDRHSYDYPVLFEYRHGESVVYGANGAQTTKTYRNGYEKSVMLGSEETKSFSYSVASNGLITTMVFEGSLGCSQWELIQRDCLGRVQRVSTSTFGGGFKTKEIVYESSTNQKQKETVSYSDCSEDFSEDILYSYEADGSLRTSCKDRNRNGQMDFYGPDEIVESVVEFGKTNGIWTRIHSLVTYPESDSDEPLTVSKVVEELEASANELPRKTMYDRFQNEALHITQCAQRDRSVLSFVLNESGEVLSVQKIENGLLVADIGEFGQTNRYEYDGLHHRIGAIDGQNGKRVFRYDANGRLSQQIDPLGGVSVFSYDNWGRLIEDSDPNESTERYLYDDRGNIVFKGGRTTPLWKQYDSKNRLIAIGTSRFAEPDSDNIDWVFFDYDESSGLQTAIRYRDGTSTTYSYHPSGLLVQKRNGRGQTTQYGYDSAMRLSLIEHSEGFPSARIEYNRMGLPQIETVDGISSNVMWYSRTGCVTNEVQNGISIVREFNDKGELVAFRCGNTKTERIENDRLGHVSTISIGDIQFDCLFDKQRGLPKGYSSPCFSKSVDYDALGRPAQLSYYGRDDVLLSSVHIQYDRASHVSTVESMLSGQTQSVMRLCVDGGGALVSASVAGETPYAGEYAYRYDNAANRIEAIDSNRALDYTANSLNQYSAIVGSTTPHYDTDGNQISILTPSGTWGLVFDPDNRLVLCTNGNRSIRMAYDARGRCVRCVNDIDEYNFVYDENQIVFIRQNNSTGNRLFWDRRDGMSPLAMDKNGELLFIHHDKNLNVFALSDTNSVIVGGSYYDPFGRSTAVGVVSPIGWSSKPEIPGLGMVLFPNRVYNPSDGRWLSRDPEGILDGGNLYHYVHNSPYDYIDPLGMAAALPFGTSIPIGLPEPPDKPKDCGKCCENGGIMNCGWVSSSGVVTGGSSEVRSHNVDWAVNLHMSRVGMKKWWNPTLCFDVPKCPDGWTAQNEKAPSKLPPPLLYDSTTGVHLLDERGFRRGSNDAPDHDAPGPTGASARICYELSTSGKDGFGWKAPPATAQLAVWCTRCEGGTK